MSPIQKVKYLLNPLFLEKSSILNSIKKILKNNSHLFKNKRGLDLGCGSKPYQELFEKIGASYEGIDFKGYSNNNSFKKTNPDYHFSEDYSMDFKLREFKDKSFDFVVSFQVLEHHQKPEMFFSESSRILKKEGTLLITFPFFWPLHEEPQDYQRLTHYQIKKLAEKNNFKIVSIVQRGGPFSIISQTLNVYVFSLNVPLMFQRLIYFLTLLPLFQYMAYFFDFVLPPKKNKILFLGYTILLKKK